MNQARLAEIQGVGGGELSGLNAGEHDGQRGVVLQFRYPDTGRNSVPVALLLKDARMLRFGLDEAIAAEERKGVGDG